MAKERLVFSTITGGWEQFLMALAANVDDFASLEEPRARLLGFLSRARALVAEQDSHTAAKQVAAKELAVVLADGQKLATYMRTGVKVRYGNRSEKLVEFGLQPFRRRSRQATEAKPPAPPPPPPVEPAGD